MEWTNPFFLNFPHGSCVECDVKLELGDHVQMERRRGTRDRKNRATKHYNCEDPGGSELLEEARQQMLKEAARTHGFGNKTKVNRYFR